ncbi:unnamed protein product, partial [Ascophyllum nodosum]
RLIIQDHLHSHNSRKSVRRRNRTKYSTRLERWPKTIVRLCVRFFEQPMGLTAGSIPKAGILMQSSGTGLVCKSTRRRAASWGFISEILTIDEIFTIVM